MPCAAPTYCFRCHWYRRGQRSVFLSSRDRALPDSMIAVTTCRGQETAAVRTQVPRLRLMNANSVEPNEYRQGGVRRLSQEKKTLRSQTTNPKVLCINSVLESRNSSPPKYSSLLSGFAAAGSSPKAWGTPTGAGRTGLWVRSTLLGHRQNRTVTHLRHRP